MDCKACGLIVPNSASSDARKGGSMIDEYDEDANRTCNALLLKAPTVMSAGIAAGSVSLVVL